VDGERDIAEVARAASSTSGRTMTAANVETLLEKLRPMGLVVGADGAEPSGHRTNPLLALRMKVAVTDPQRTRALTAPFARLFHPIVVVAVVAPFGWICWWSLPRSAGSAGGCWSSAD
jgi:putative peptide zinc metalloprotease protein